MRFCEVGDVFRDNRDRLWKCVMVTQIQAVLRHAKRIHPDMILPREISDTNEWAKERLIFAWSENQPGVVQTSKVNPLLN